MVAWAWKESATAAFDIITWTGDGGMGGQAVSHGLGVVPEMIIVKSRTSAISWIVHHKDLSHSTYNKYLTLNETAAEASYGSANAIGTLTDSSVTFDNSMDMMTMTFISLNFGAGPGGYPPATDYVAYMFASVEGYSKVGSYTGNASADGTFVALDFAPIWIMVKSLGSASWYIHDTARSPYNYSDLELQADSSGAEYSVSGEGAGERVDLLSNGFKHRTTNDAMNGIGDGSGQKYIFYAIGQSSKYANAR
jgi:hypothetical protein